MRIRQFLYAAISLIVYLGWICGYSAVVLSCHCHATEKCCCCHSQKQDISSLVQNICADTHCSCTHSHSTQITLYDISKKSSSASPLQVSFTIIDSDTQNIIAETLFNAGERLQKKRYTPPYFSVCPLRAPPVMA
ncbi:MAG: hypothetical protein KBS95_07350 [Alistipes sp.]|nr:hypothetical protein [Candidatus Alistipes equi]